MCIDVGVLFSPRLSAASEHEVKCAEDILEAEPESAEAPNTDRRYTKSPQIVKGYFDSAQ